MPPDWLFPVAWSVIYVLLGLAVATVIHARGARGRWPAVALFAVEIVALAAWQPLFFGLHRIWAALGLIGFILLCGIATAVLFGRVRDGAAWLMVPLLIWVSFAGVLNWRFGQLNPDAERVARGPRTTQMI